MFYFNQEDIQNKAKNEESFVKSGVEIIDRRMRGLKKVFVSVVSGLRGSAKSTWLTEMWRDMRLNVEIMLECILAN